VNLGATSSSREPPFWRSTDAGRGGGQGAPLTASIPTGAVWTGRGAARDLGSPQHRDVAARPCATGYAAAAPHPYHRASEAAVSPGTCVALSNCSTDFASPRSNRTSSVRATISPKPAQPGSEPSASRWAPRSRTGRRPACPSRPSASTAAASAEHVGTSLDSLDRVLRRHGHRHPVEEVEQLRPAVELAAAPTQIIRYPHAAHRRRPGPR
jgi:hypothetical protein